MSNEASTAVTPDANQETQKAFFDQVNEATSQLTAGEDGALRFPDGVEMTEEVKVAAFAEKKRRTMQGALATSNSELAILQAENKELKALAMQGKRVTISTEDQEALDELKFEDPDAWRVKMNELEQTATLQVTSKLSEISDAAKTNGAKGEREVLLQAFMDDNPGFTINDEVLANDVPPRISKKLENGESSFIEFLTEVKDYLGAGKVIAKPDASDDPNLNSIGGASTPSNEAQKKDSETAYEDELF